MIKTICYLFLFSLIEFILMYLITNWICIVNFEYVSLKYTSFSFSNSKEDSPTGLNILLKIFFPPSYIVVLSGILYKIGANYLVDNIVFVTVIYYLIKWLICTLLFNRARLINWGNEIFCFVFSLFLSWGIYECFISKTDKIFIPLDQLRDGVWMAIITFFFGIIVKIIYTQSKLNLSKQKFQIKKYINKQYKRYIEMFDDLINTDDVTLKKITYAIMIYENYNRPKFIRLLENIKFYITGHATLGIMQVSTEKYIDDYESVRRGYNMIKTEYDQLMSTRLREKQADDSSNKEKISTNDNTEEYFFAEEDIKRIISIYNKGDKYVEEVMFIYGILQNKK